MLKTKGWKYYFVEREKEGENLYVPSSDRVGSPDAVRISQGASSGITMRTGKLEVYILAGVGLT